jgi:hypothetical protein
MKNMVKIYSLVARFLPEKKKQGTTYSYSVTQHIATTGRERFGFAHATLTQADMQVTHTRK